MTDAARRLSPEDARDRYLAKRETSATDRTIDSYRARLKHFIEWCDEHDIEQVGDLTPFHIDEFDLHTRQQDYAQTTIKGHLACLRTFLKYLNRIDAVDEAVCEAVEVPTLSKEEESNDERLAPDDAVAAIQAHRDSPALYGTPQHAYLEVVWYTAARMGSIRALDIGDYDPDEGYVSFQHKPSSGTPLKNKHDGERLVGLPQPCCDVLDTYIARERFDKRDEHGREPLFCQRQGRPSFSTFRGWSYAATQPCLHGPCPHDEERETCDYVHRTHASKCPSSRSSHRIRTGSITWQLNQGLDPETVAARVNATPRVIRRFYDKQTDVEEFEERRRTASAALAITNDE